MQYVTVKVSRADPQNRFVFKRLKGVKLSVGEVKRKVFPIGKARILFRSNIY